MKHRNVEIKARCRDAKAVRAALLARGARPHGTDRQTDTYFHVPRGRLKLRQGNIETALIHYDRPDRPGPKQARIRLYRPPDPPALKAVLSAALGVRAVVAKTREIFFLDNVKFHIDSVRGLGRFVEIEAIGAAGTIGPDRLRRQCRRYMRLLGIGPADLVAGSYADMTTAG